MALDYALLDTAGAGTQFDLAKKEFMASALAAFDQAIRAWDMVTKEQLTGAVQREFIKTWLLDAEEHVPGAEIAGQTLDKTPINVRLEDRETIAYAKQTVRDQLISHWDHRGRLAEEVGRALARQFDKHSLQQLCKAAATAASGNFVGGQTTTRSGSLVIATAYPMSLTGSQRLQTDIQATIQLMFEDNVDIEQEMYCFLKKREHNVLKQDNSLLSHDYVGEVYADKIKGKLVMVENCWIIPTNNFPQTDLSGNTWPLIAGAVAYAADFRYHIAAIMARDALAAVYAEGISPAMDWIPERRQWQIGAAALKGIATYRPECAGRIIIAA